ncbi:MAG: lysozyme [Rhodospirillaceae bacterium]|nr:MAG: lysozyme [Rhodospirillaceae bacterium]
MNITLLKQELIRDEGLRLKPYRCPAGKLTIGVGRNLDDRGISEAEAMVLLDNDIAIVVDELGHALPWWQALPEGPDRALANMTVNMGAPRLLGFRQMLGALKQGDYVTAAKEAQNSQWARQVGDRAKHIANLIQAARE